MCNLDVLEVPIIVALVIVIIYELCITVINSVNLCRPIYGKIKEVTSLREYIKCSRRIPK